MKRNADSEEINDHPLKKQKLDFWDQVEAKIQSKTKIEDGHVVCIKEIKHNKYPIFTFDGKILPIYAWYYFSQKKSLERSEDTKFRKWCHQENCISHFLLQSLYLTSVLQMTENDYKLAWKLIYDGSEESDIDPGNVELKTKCRLWTGDKDEKGYGYVKFMGNTMHASRLSYMLATKLDFPDELVCRHKCANKSCVNHDHLEPGTQKENMIDASVRDKTLPMGKTHYLSSISDETAIKIFWSKLDKLTQQERADKFETSLSIVKEIDSGRNRKHLFSDEDRLKCHGNKKTRNIRPITFELFDEIKTYQLSEMSVKKCSELTKIGYKRIRQIYKGEYKLNLIKNNLDDKKWFEIKLTNIEISSTIERIMKNCIITEDGHWLSKLKLTPKGYTKISFKSKKIYTHRLAYWLSNGLPSMPRKDFVRHKCLSKNCTNPAHLEIGTAKDNRNDQDRDGTAPVGEKHSRALVDNATAQEIKDAKGTMTMLQRAEKFGVPLSFVKNIDGGRAWKHLKEKEPEESKMGLI